ncbi:MAG: hypothetical protein JWM58_1086 [Rhizobium sp.]|nr:hypothetical protein [Rhizobium sp.]
MILPQPQIGMVIRYSYLWASEANAGRDEGSKDRPCAIILMVRDIGGQMRIQVLPVTHSPPPKEADAVEIPAPVKKHLDLDHQRSWVVISEYNEFIWPGYDLRPTGKADDPVYGFLPQKFFQHLTARFLERQKRIGTRRT